MAIKRKGCRLIIIDGISYRWNIRRKPTYCQSQNWSNLYLAVERTEIRGAKLIADMPHPHPGGLLEGRPLLPSEVEKVIRQAILKGWCSSQEGKPFYLDEAEVVQAVGNVSGFGRAESQSITNQGLFSSVLEPFFGNWQKNITLFVLPSD